MEVQGIYFAFIFIFAVEINTVTSLNEATNCGKILKGTSGIIKYKPSEPLTQQCVWTIRSPGSLKLNFTLVQNSLKSPSDRIVISSFKRIGGGPLVQNVTLFQGYSKPVILSGNVAIVVFYSTDLKNGTGGFILNYTGIGEDPKIISDSSRDLILEENAGHFVHPEITLSQQYSNYELSTFVIAPKEYGLNDTVGLTAKISFENGFELCGQVCCDSAVLYESKDFLLIPREEYCQPSITSTGLFKGSGLLVYVFTSDDMNTHKGFSVKYSRL